jgi:hypothetical protein
MNYIVKLTTGGQFVINKEEAEFIASQPDNASITLKRLGVVIQKRMIMVFPESIADELEDRKKQLTGILHDGTKVVRKFGMWVDGGVAADDNGNYSSVKLDTTYYPEVAMDKVATEKEWQEIRETKQDYYEYLGINKDIKRIDGSGFKHLLEN